MKLRSTKLSRFACVCGIAIAVSCGDATETAPSQLNLDHPTDLAFACWGGLRITNGQPMTDEQPVGDAAQPLASCDTRATPRPSGTPQPVPPGQEDVGPVAYYGFILQSTKGTVAIARWEPKPPSAFGGEDVLVLDTDPLTPGKNGISVGEDPIAIATDTSGCKEVIANAGSCDMSILDVNSALDVDPAIDVQRLTVSNRLGQPVAAKPAAMAMEPMRTEVGFACSATATGLAYVAYPSCHLVAGIDVATGRIEAAIRYDANGVATILTGATLDGVTCTDECSGGGGAVTDGPRPVTLDLELDPRTASKRLAIGSDNFASITLVELGGDSKPLSLAPIALENTSANDLGVTTVAISPVMGMGGASGTINDGAAVGGDMQFLYAIATDNSVRVAEILSLGKECDTQVDPRFIDDVRNVRALSCLVVGDAATPPRRAGADGPGQRLVGDAIPTGLEFGRADPTGNENLSGPSELIGYFAYVASSTGQVFVINVDDDRSGDLIDLAAPLNVQLPLAIAHQLRDGIPARDLIGGVRNAETMMTDYFCDDLGPDPDAQSGNRGGPRTPTNPTRTLPNGVINGAQSSDLPNIRHVTCVGVDTTKPTSELSYAARPDVRKAAYPDLRALRSDEIWSITWEGLLSNDDSDVAIDGPRIRESMMFVDAFGMRLADQTRPFCSAGVEEYDIVQMRGCDPTQGGGDCPVGYTCYTHPESRVAGLGSCMLENEADRLAEACKSFTTSLRRYTVRKSSAGTLVLAPRKRVLRTTPLTGCIDDAQCKTLADYTAQQASSAHPLDLAENPPTDPFSYTCAADPLRAPLEAPGNTGKRCIMTCESTDDCADGTVCEAGVCMESVVPPQACINAPQRYELRAHDALTLLGTRSGYIHATVADAGGNCVKDPTAPVTQIGRIPLYVEDCDPTADPLTGQLPSGEFEPNPCAYDTTESELSPRYAADSCAAGNPSQELVDRPTRAIKVRNPGMTFSIVDPTYPGDLRCHGDRMLGLENVPHVATNFQIQFRQTGGFSPILIPISPAFPVRVVRGPSQSIWVIDEGDFLSTSVAAPSTRGKVFRFEASIVNTINVLQ